MASRSNPTEPDARNDGPAPDAARGGAHWPWCLALVLLILPGYARLLVGDEGAIGRDYGTVFLDALTQQRAALLDGHVLLWDPSQVGGTAFWPLPNECPLYPPLMACLLVRGNVEGLNLCIFLHVVWGALGTYALVHLLGGSRLAALVGGVMFAYGYFTQHLVDILPLEALASAWIPWALYGLCRALTSTRWLRWAAFAALAYAALPWLGSYIQFLPGLVLAGVIVLVASLRRPGLIGRGLASMLVFGVIMALVSAAKLLPTLHWIKLTDRAGGITEGFAMGGALRPADVLEWTQREGWAPWALLLCGLLLGLRRRDSFGLPFAAAVAVLMLISSGLIYKAMYDYIPGFQYVREPRRVWLLMPAVLPVAAGLGLTYLQERVPWRGRRGALAAGLVLLAVAADMIVWSRYDPPLRQSLSARVAANAIHQNLASRARKEPRFRVIDATKTRARVKQTADLMRSSLGLESMEGIMGNVAITAYDIDYLEVCRDARAKLLGLMNCRYLTSPKPLDDPDLSFVARFPLDRQCAVMGSDGPLLYSNDLALPRASLSGHALLQVGGASLDQKTLLESAWDPRRAVLIRVEPAQLAALTDAELARFDAAVLWAPVDDALRARLVAAGVDCLDRREATDPSALDSWLGRVLPATPTLKPIADPPREWNAEHVQLPADAGGRWLVLAETFAIYPGWSATVDGAPAPLFVANAVTTAILLPQGAREVALAYSPPGLAAGLGLTLAGLLLAGCAILWRPARGGRAAALTPPAPLHAAPRAPSP
ncbi:MAG TPA: hypothetical protein VFY71_09575 [Planctomycetota bacterium]|nr:hypothetical protein [Planctomycetota bacterium]